MKAIDKTAGTLLILRQQGRDRLGGLRARHCPVALCAAALAVVAASCSSPAATTSAERVTGGPTGHYVVNPGIHKIKHIVVIQEENRSFDSYFGTFPGER